MMRHTLVVALNPSVDVEWRVSNVRWEEKNVLEGERRWPGGKGVNVARWLKLLGGRPRLLLPLGGASGDEMQEGLRRENIEARVVPLREATRANIIVTTSSQGQLRFNPPGPRLSNVDWKRIQSAIKLALRRATLVVLSGSLPRGLPASVYFKIAGMAQRAGVRVLLDCDGETFRNAIRARPFLVKPNEHELEQFWKRPLRDEKARRRAALELSEKTQGWVLLSCGGQGAMLVHAREKILLCGRAPSGKTLNTVGAGDAMLAAVAKAIEEGANPVEWLRNGVGTGTALTLCAAGSLPSATRIRRMIRAVLVQ